MCAFSPKMSDISDCQQAGLSRLNLFDVFSKQDFGYDDNQSDIEVESENKELDQYQSYDGIILHAQIICIHSKKNDLGTNYSLLGESENINPVIPGETCGVHGQLFHKCSDCPVSS